MHFSLYTVSKWAGAITAVLVLGGWMSRSSVRLSKIEERAARVPSIEHHIRVQTIFMKLSDSTKFKLAEELAK